MPQPVQNIIPFLVACALLGTACGSEIGDSCNTSIDCSPNGDRYCELSESSPGGYCTVVGCDYDTCPDEAVCVRFFSAVSTNLPCDPDTEDIGTDDCTPDELCTVGGTCMPRQAETRYCMRSCESSGDCREGYECRDRELMMVHGGEPVLAPGESRTGALPSFCAFGAVQ